MLGAVASQKGVGGVPSPGHPFSTVGGMHHGTTNAILLPVVLEYNRPAVAERMAQLSALFGGGDPAERVRELNRRLNIKPRLRDWGVAESILPALADTAVHDGCHLLNPRACSRDVADPANPRWFSNCQFYLDGWSGAVVPTPISPANQYARGGRPIPNGVPLAISKEFSVIVRLPGKQALTDQVFYALFYNFL